MSYAKRLKVFFLHVKNAQGNELSQRRLERSKKELDQALKELIKACEPRKHA